LHRLKYLRLDPWKRWPLIFTESRSLAGTLRPLANEYRALLAATNGQCTGFFHTKLKSYLPSVSHVLKPPTSQADTRAWLSPKGIRDVVSGLVLLTIRNFLQPDIDNHQHPDQKFLRCEDSRITIRLSFPVTEPSPLSA
jgi:hypothetical protein